MARWSPKFGFSLTAPLVLAAAYFGVATLSLMLTRGEDGIATIWPPSGVLLATLLTVPRRALWRFAAAAAVASLAANLVTGTDLQRSIGFTSANIIESMVAALLLRRRSGRRVSFVDLQNVSGFFTASLAAAAASATIAALVARDADRHFVLSWFATVWLGILLITPLLLTMFEFLTSSKTTMSRADGLNLVAIVAMAFGVSSITFFQTSLPILFLPVMSIILGVLRGGALGGIIVIAITTCVGSCAIAIDSGPVTLFHSDHPAQVLFFQLYALALFVSALPMAALLTARDRLQVGLAERIRLLDQAERFAHIGHWRVDAVNQAIYWSPEVFRIHGVAPGQPPSMEQAIDAYHVDDRPRITEVVERALADGQPFEFEARLVRPDGTIRHVISRGERDYSSRDEEIGLFGLVQDVTDQVEARRTLQEAREAAERSERMALALADTDALTGLANRRNIVRNLSAAIAVAERDHQDLSVAIFDIDHFKSVNDRYGHDVGDVVLRRVALAASDGLRREDLIGRYGGEEFVLILPRAAAVVALRIAERVRSSVEHRRGEAGEPAVTVSLGIAAFERGETIEALLKRADIALYHAKGSGRNRLHLAA